MVDEQLVVFVAYSENVRVSGSDDTLIIDRMRWFGVKNGAILLHVTEISFPAEMLNVEIPYGHSLGLPPDVLILHSISIMQIFVILPCQSHGMFPFHAGSLSGDARILAIHIVVLIHENIIVACVLQKSS